MHTGLTKENAFVAFMAINKACGNCLDCRKGGCHVNISKEILTHLSATGDRRVKDMLPADILDILRALPVENGRIEKFKAITAFDTVSQICDDCLPEKHGEFCGVNITLTALGTLLFGSSFQTEKDRELLRAHE